LVNEPALASYFEAGVSELDALDPAASKLVLYNYLTSDLKGLLNEFKKALPDALPPEHLAHLAALVHQKRITSRQAKDMLRIMVDKGLDPETLMRQEDIGGVLDEQAVFDAIRDVIAAHPKAVADYKAGKTMSLQFLVGKTMGVLKGKADPAQLQALILAEIADA